MKYKLITKEGTTGPFTEKELATRLDKGEIREDANLVDENNELRVVSDVLPVGAQERSTWETVFWSYMWFFWGYSLVTCCFLVPSGRAPASVPANLFLVVYLAWGFIGLGCVNILLSVFLCFVEQFKPAAVLFFSIFPPVAFFFLLVFSSH
jgi:hypothetical protein